MVEVTLGPHKGFVGTIAGGGEDTEGTASIMGITESGTISYPFMRLGRVARDSFGGGRIWLRLCLLKMRCTRW